MKLQAYLHFEGNCEEAFRFYERCLGGKIEVMMRYEASPAEAQVPKELGDKILHARLVVDGEVLMASDAMPGHYHKPQGFSVSIQVEQPSRAEEVCKALSAGGSVVMPMQETFFAERFAMFSDKFGIPWMVNCTGNRQN